MKKTTGIYSVCVGLGLLLISSAGLAEETGKWGVKVADPRIDRNINQKQNENDRTKLKSGDVTYPAMHRRVNKDQNENNRNYKSERIDY